MTIKWKQVNSFGNGRLYQVSDMGEVAKIDSDQKGNVVTMHLVKQWDNGNNTAMVDLYDGGVRKHVRVGRLVAEAFLKPVPGKPYVRHIDGNPWNNCVDNLEYATRSEITARTHYFSRPVVKISSDGQTENYQSLKQASEHLNMTVGQVRYRINYQIKLDDGSELHWGNEND